MSLISATIPNFVNGISQQPYALRLPTQGQTQENGISTISSGLRKRAPTEALTKLSATPISDAFIHMINRDDVEQYQIVLTDGLVRVFDLAGNPKTVVMETSAYLNTSLPASQAFAVTTVADYTFIVNKTKVTANRAATKAVRQAETIISVKLGNYGKTYSIKINDLPAASYSTPVGDNANQSPQVATNAIALNLYDQLVTGGYSSGPWILINNGSSLHLRNSAADFTITCEDGFGNNAMVVIKDNLQKFADLPAYPKVSNFTVQIVGDQSSDFDNYWVRFDSTANTGGIWRETLKPGMVLGLDPLTMPHKLVREADGTFTFKTCAWDDRTVGDTGSSPDPSFVGHTINDLFFFQNRLGFLSDENFIQTETGKYFNLYRTSVISLLDSDPVDVNAATNKVAILQHAITFNKQLLLFSVQQQFLVDSTVLMSPKKVPIRPTTDFVCDIGAKPVAAGKNVYFMSNKGNWSALREFYAETISTVNDAANVSAHCPMYVPKNVVKIANGAAEDILVMLSSDDRSKLYIYKYFFSGNDKLQSSWSVFTFPTTDTILTCDFVKSVLYLTVSRASGVYIEKMDFAMGSIGTGEPYQVLLDRKVQIPTSSLSFDGVKTIINLTTIGYTPDDGTYMAVAKGGGAVLAGQILPVTWAAGLVSVPGNVTASGLSFGRSYAFKYTLSTLAARTPQKDGGTAVETDGRTQVRRITLNHADSGFYRVLVTPLGRQTYTYVFSGAYIGTGTAILGTQALNTDRFSAPVMTRNTTATITVDSNMPLPLALLSANWEAVHTDRSMNV